MTGASFTSLACNFRLGKSTVGSIVRETCTVIWDTLVSQELPTPDVNIWKRNADEFLEQWNFPHCVAALDGKHIRLRAPPMSGSRYFNYKGYHSIVLLAAVDAQRRFVVIDVGAYGSRSDGGMLQGSTFGQLLESNTLNLPTLSCIPGTDIVVPFVFVGDEAFPLKTNLMRPFPQRHLTNDARIFNYRLSRARRQVECTFGDIICQKW